MITLIINELSSRILDIDNIVKDSIVVIIVIHINNVID